MDCKSNTGENSGFEVDYVLLQFGIIPKVDYESSDDSALLLPLVQKAESSSSDESSVDVGQ